MGIEKILVGEKYFYYTKCQRTSSPFPANCISVKFGCDNRGWSSAKDTLVVLLLSLYVIIWGWGGGEGGSRMYILRFYYEHLSPEKGGTSFGKNYNCLPS